jgi:hypothetical protein
VRGAGGGALRADARDAQGGVERGGGRAGRGPDPDADSGEPVARALNLNIRAIRVATQGADED